ncbi:MAG: metallophosphatase family protein [Lachnospiraceae bacterium]|nr:metallophosphatase family protein [Lachnospiraceae bacterium]
MGKVLVIPDVHLKAWMFDEADKIDRDSYDGIVVLGDLVDDWGKGNDIQAYEDTLSRAARFASEHQESLWCYGNHDVSYLWDAMESGYSVQARQAAIDGVTRLERVLEERLQFVHKIENTIFSHAGLTESFVLQTCGRHGTDIEDILFRINRMSMRELWRNNSPIWARPQMEFYRMFREDLYQVVGHTPVEEAVEASGVLSLDLFSTYSDGTPFGNRKFYIVDTENKTYKEAE